MTQDQLSELESIILNWVSHDYETIEYIKGNVSSDFGEELTNEMIHNTLLKLQSKGLVDSYYYSEQDRKFINQKPVGGYPEKDIFWYISSKYLAKG